MIIQVLLHAEFENEGLIGEWAGLKGNIINRTALHRGEAAPPKDGFDMLVIMGGPMNVYEEEKYPWLAHEKKFIKETVSSGRPVLGICLGAQLIACALGAGVRGNPEREIGWFETRLLSGAGKTRAFSGFPDKFVPFHWHGDTFDVPEGAIPCAESEACGNQAFVFNEKTVGLQFHLEFSREGLLMISDGCADDLAPGEFVQDIREFFKDDGLFEKSRELLFLLMDNLSSARPVA
ncbi:MAG: type 1 glutamine amidotransferase [Spirochaetes bacterium]|jgi:GMP synthase-like glutamine amidotransferase|nr:type 1 glutamine amidotransferase [Spirochaetota bacterium]